MAHKTKNRWITLLLTTLPMGPLGLIHALSDQGAKAVSKTVIMVASPSSPTRVELKKISLRLPAISWFGMMSLTSMGPLIQTNGRLNFIPTTATTSSRITRITWIIYASKTANW